MSGATMLLVLCAVAGAAAQFAPLHQFNTNARGEDRRRELSPQQQGHILSDIQQHQHRFQLHQAHQQSRHQQPPFSAELRPPFQQSGQFAPDRVPAGQAAPFGHLLSQQSAFLRPNQQDAAGKGPGAFRAAGQFGAPNHIPAGQAALFSQHLAPAQQDFRPVPTAKQPEPTQQSFPDAGRHEPPNSPRPGAFFDPEKEQQRLKELRLKQQIIDKHNQFVEKQYEKALKKAQDEHLQWLEKQRDNRKKLYQTVAQRPEDALHLYHTDNRPRVIYPEEVPLFHKAVEQYYELHPTTTTTTTTEAPSTSTTQKVKTITLDEKDLGLLLAKRNLTSRLKGKDETTTKEPSSLFLPTVVPESKGASIKSVEQLELVQRQYQQQLLQRDDLLQQLKQALAEVPEEDAGKNFTSREISLANGRTVQVIKTTDPKLVEGARPLGSAGSGPKFIELPAPAASTPAPSAVLEELTRGVLPPGANYELIRHSGQDGESVVEPGKLPANKKVTFVLLEEQADGSYKVQGVKGNHEQKGKEESPDVDAILKRIKDGDIKLPPSKAAATTAKASTKYPSTTETARTSRFPSSTAAASTTEHRQSTPAKTLDVTVSPNSHPGELLESPTSRPSFASTTVRLASSSTSAPPTASLVEILRKRGLFAMAKFLRQSGLDTILNETGPYTIFVPTDKAFRSLLIQLGGPDKAEQKFKENPRLLSGLLLHHVIPGAFEIGSLQDEMTGVSLAGTQLRVNQYLMQDAEWNELKTTTVNGARVLANMQDVQVPQGVAHALDRVMFPLPVGDLVQTLRADRERRFTKFLAALAASGLEHMLQGSKTYTVFAPVDSAWPSEDKQRGAKELVQRHLLPGTLYTTGMRYYQVRDTLQQGKQLALDKTSGRIKVNDLPLATQNIPATNGVIHAMDGLL